MLKGDKERFVILSLYVFVHCVTPQANIPRQVLIN